MNVKIPLIALLTWGAFIPDTYSESLINRSHYYKKIVISEIASKNEAGATSYKISINNISVTLNKQYANLYLPSPGSQIWEIGTQLPISETDCDIAYASLCDNDTNKLYEGSCFSPCIAYGPEFTAFDEKSGKLYFTASSASIGTSGGPYFLFEADINTQKIKFIKSIIGPIEGSLSPNGSYLLLTKMNSITIYDTHTEVFSTLSKHSELIGGKKYQHRLNNIRWLSEKEFQFTDNIRHDKFQHIPDRQIEETYRINS